MISSTRSSTALSASVICSVTEESRTLTAAANPAKAMTEDSGISRISLPLSSMGMLGKISAFTSSKTGSASFNIGLASAMRSACASTLQVSSTALACEVHQSPDASARCPSVETPSGTTAQSLIMVRSSSAALVIALILACGIAPDNGAHATQQCSKKAGA